VTFRLYDWDRVDAQTGRPRALHVEQALACIDYASQVRGPAKASLEKAAPIRREHLATCRYFELRRIQAEQEFSLGKRGSCRILVAIEGQAQLQHGGQHWPLRPGYVMLLPAELEECCCQPAGSVQLLEVTLP
jgi:mannose-6-phosphate isomerase